MSRKRYAAPAEDQGRVISSTPSADVTLEFAQEAAEVPLEPEAQPEEAAPALPAGLVELREATEGMDEQEARMLDWLAANPEEDGSHLVDQLAEITNRRRALDGGWRAV